jgi:GNAT superfamily N-acetyltransferase
MISSKWFPPAQAFWQRRKEANVRTRIRPAIVEDAPLICGFIRDLAEYERLLDDCVATAETVAATLFAPAPRALYVRPPFRGCGLGKALLVHLAQRAMRENCGRFEWSVLDWNAPSIAFYEALGAKPVSGWTRYRLDGEALAQLGAK